jgi:hypothetical protein
MAVNEIPEVSNVEAYDYLKLRGMGNEDQRKIYELVGGRMDHLKAAANVFQYKTAFEGTCIVYYANDRPVSHHICRHKEATVQ